MIGDDRRGALGAGSSLVIRQQVMGCSHVPTQALGTENMAEVNGPLMA